MRDHEPITFDTFNGFWQRKPFDSVPKDHWSDVNNIRVLQNAFNVRDGLNTFLPFINVVRMYTYPQLSRTSLLLLDSGGNIYDTGSASPQNPILHVANMTDFGFTAINGRAFISPSDGTKGLSGQSIYIYKGDGTQARLAGGAPPTGNISLALGAAGITEAGTHVLGVCYETDTGYITAPAAFATIVTDAAHKINITNIPVSGSSSVVARRIVATQSIASYNGNTTGYKLFFIPGARIADNVTTSLTVDFYDATLISDATSLLNNFTNIPAGCGLTTFHNRLVSWTENANVTTVRLSLPGQPEAVDQVGGLITAPIGAKQLTNCQEYRNVLYVFEENRTYGYADDGTSPVDWQMQIIDRGLGTTVHGISTVLDTSGANVEFLLTINSTAVNLFNGYFQFPELSWKIEDFWRAQTGGFDNFQILTDTLNKLIYVNLNSNTLLVGDYKLGMNAQSIRWSRWTFPVKTSTIAFMNTNQLIIGALQSA